MPPPKNAHVPPYHGANRQNRTFFLALADWPQSSPYSLLVCRCHCELGGGSFVQVCPRGLASTSRVPPVFSSSIRSLLDGGLVHSCVFRVGPTAELRTRQGRLGEVWETRSGRALGCLAGEVRKTRNWLFYL